MKPQGFDNILGLHPQSLWEDQSSYAGAFLTN